MRAEQLCVSIAQILARQCDNGLVLRNRGQDIDKSEQLRLEDRVLHGQVQRLVRPPMACENRGSLIGGETSELFTDTANG